MSTQVCEVRCLWRGEGEGGVGITEGALEDSSRTLAFFSCIASSLHDILVSKYNFSIGAELGSSQGKHPYVVDSTFAVPLVASSLETLCLHFNPSFQLFLLFLRETNLIIY